VNDDDAAACRTTCRETHIDGACRTRCMAHHRYWNQGEGFRQNAAASDAASAQRRAEAQAPITAYLAAQRRKAHGT
jgi:hypothetical protein